MYAVCSALNACVAACVAPNQQPPYFLQDSTDIYIYPWGNVGKHWAYGLHILPLDPVTGTWPSFLPPHIHDDCEFGARARLPTPDAEALVDGLEHAQVLIDAVTVPCADLEHVEGGVEQEGKLAVRALGGTMGWEKGDVERVVLGVCEVRGCVQKMARRTSHACL